MNPNRTLPAEWAPQSGVMLTWPHAHGDFARILDRVEPVFVEIAHAVTRFERLLVGTYDAAHREHVRARLTARGVDLGRCVLHVVPSNDVWARDHGPVTVLEGEAPRLLDFTFNGWGNKFDATLDNRVSAALHTQGAFGATPMERIELVLEGGGIESDGEGTLLTTAECQLSPERNPQLDQAGIEAQLCRLFGVERVLWLHHGALEGDDTDGHVDTLARFCDPRTIAYVQCEDEGDSHYPTLQRMEEELRALRTRDGEPYRLVPLPLPDPVHDEEGQRLPATYANFLIIDGAVLVPVYRDRHDDTALERLADAFPGREIVAIDCRPLIEQYGSLHCVTMQLPAGVLP